MDDLTTSEILSLPLKRQSKKPFKWPQVRTLQKRALRPAAIEIGYLAIAWNALQEGLCELFSCVTVERGCDPAVFNAIWHSTPSDRSQKDMLRRAISAVKSDDPLMPQLCEDISWILQKLNALTGRRNNALHAPLIAPCLSRQQKVEIEPLCRSGNPRALELANKPIVEEFKWYRDHVEKLSQFADELLLAFYFRENGFAWPDRPELPSRGRYQNQKKSRPKSGAK